MVVTHTLFNKNVIAEIVTTIVDTSVIIKQVDKIDFYEKDQIFYLDIYIQINDNIYDFINLLSESCNLVEDKLKSQLDSNKIYIEFKIN